MVTVVIVVAWCIAFDVLSLLQCPSHFSAFWGSFEVHKRYCDLNPVWAKGLAISDFILDLWVVMLPVPMVCSVAIVVFTAKLQDPDLASST